MKVLLIEDEQSHCDEYIKCAACLPYPVELCAADGGDSGIEMTCSFMPDIILLDLELHKGDKDGLMYLNDLSALNLSQNPYVIIITHNISKRTYDFARKSGADYIFPKSKPDYSPRLVLDFAYNYYKNQPVKSSLSTDEADLYDKITHEMDMVGIMNGMGGRNYIIDAIMYILSLYPHDSNASDINLNKTVYPVLAKKYKKSIGSIEQGIKNAIQKAWLITDIDTLAENYTATVNYKSGYPSNKDFIFYYVDKYKVSGHG